MYATKPGTNTRWAALCMAHPKNPMRTRKSAQVPGKKEMSPEFPAVIYKTAKNGGKTNVEIAP